MLFDASIRGQLYLLIQSSKQYNSHHHLCDFIIPSNMFNAEGKLIVIHEYPTPSLQPFLNPICKDTYEALPKIYGPTRKKKYTPTPFISKHCEHRCLRECCIHRYQQHRSKTDVKAPRPKAKIDRNLTKSSPKQLSYDSGKQIRISRPKKIIPRQAMLKEFNSQELNQAQSKHKVYHPIGRSSVMEIECLSESRQKEGKHASAKGARPKDTSVNMSSHESAQTQPKYFEEEKELLRNRTKTQPTQPQNNYTQRYYEYLENDPKLHQPKNDQPTKKAKLDNKRSQTSEADNLSISSSVIKQRKGSTMFHKFKQRQALGTSAKKSKAYSVLSNGLFKIPEEEQFQDYLLHYKPMNPNFDVKKLVKEDNFHIIPKDGKVFFGQVVDKKRHGDGITVSEKQIFEGKYEDDFKTVGCEKNRDGTYTGEYLNGKRHGKGKFVWYNGQVFEGEWKGGKKNGFGVWKSPKGDYYEGQWVENRQNGEGYFFHLGGSKYRGEFKDFLKHGKGQEEFPNGDKYNGEYSFGKPHGKGKYSWSNGDTYEGSFQEGSRSGWGVLKRRSGQVYQGQFKNDLKHGEGRQHFKSGQSFEGIFKEGERVSGTLKTSGGAVIKLTE